MTKHKADHQPIHWNGEYAPNGIKHGEPGSKLDAGKTNANLLKDFSLALTAIAEVATFGANKYSKGGWQFVEDGISRYADAGVRHWLKENSEEFDQDSKLRHIAHRAWNVLAELELILRDKGSQ